MGKEQGCKPAAGSHAQKDRTSSAHDLPFATEDWEVLALRIPNCCCCCFRCRPELAGHTRLPLVKCRQNWMEPLPGSAMMACVVLVAKPDSLSNSLLLPSCSPPCPHSGSSMQCSRSIDEKWRLACACAAQLLQSPYDSRNCGYTYLGRLLCSSQPGPAPSLGIQVAH